MSHTPRVRAGHASHGVMRRSLLSRSATPRPMSPAKFCKIGAAKRIRTPDPRITNALLYQLSYCGVANARGGILTRGIDRRKTDAVLCDAAQSPGQGKNHVFRAPLQFFRDFPAPLTQLRNHTL